MNRSHITAREAENLYVRWYDSVAQRVREAAAQARGRRDRYRSDLADLHRDLGSVELRGLLEPEPEALPGTSAQAAADADGCLAEAEQQHAWGAHKAAIVWLQQAHIAANLAIELADGTVKPELIVDGPISPRPPAPAQTDRNADQPEGPDDPGWFPQIPAPRRPY